MTPLKACAIAALWADGTFDSADIAHAVDVPEAQVMVVLDLMRDARHDTQDRKAKA